MARGQLGGAVQGLCKLLGDRTANQRTDVQFLIVTWHNHRNRLSKSIVEG